MIKVSSVIFLLFLTLISINSITTAYSQEEEYFGDFLIEISPTGIAKITGDTDYEPYQLIENTQEFTSKNKDIWILNITTEETFEFYIYEIIMPKGTEIINMNDKSRAKVFSRDKLIILGEGENEPLNIYVEYRIDYSEAYSTLTYTIIITLILGIIIGTSTIIIIKKIRKRNKNKKQPTSENIKNTKEEPKVKELNFDLSIYPARQQDIIKIIMEKQKISQKELEDMMQIPSSSISRNIKSLQAKKIIIKERIGQTNYLSLNEEVMTK